MIPRTIVSSRGIHLALLVLVPCVVADPLPSHVDLRPTFDGWGLGIVPQHERRSCSVHTFTRALEAALARHTGQGIPLSDEYLNWACNQVIGNKGPGARDRGQFFEHLWKGYKQHGICRRDWMPWSAYFDPLAEPAPGVIEEARARRDVEYLWHPISTPNSPAAHPVPLVKAILAAGWPVLAGAAHSVLIVGYDDDGRSPGGGRFFISDSGTGTYIDRLRDSRWHSAISYHRVGDYDLSWIEGLAPGSRP